MTDKRGTGRTALITGASSGIGLELARLFAGDGYRLIVSARRTAALEQLAAELKGRHGTEVTVIAQDLSRPGAAGALAAAIEGAGLTVDVLVNNAGIGLAGNLAGNDPAALTGMLQLNVVALTELTRLLLPGMLQRRQGRILNVGSLTGYQPGGPGMAAYYASKGYVLSLSRGLARELRGSGVTVTALCPGTTATEFEQTAGAVKTRLYRILKPMSAAVVARAGYEAMHRGVVSCVPGWLNRILAFGGELPPRQIAIEINRFLLGDAG
jgi:short-subunit dehydrogenase